MNCLLVVSKNSSVCLKLQTLIIPFAIKVDSMKQYSMKQHFQVKSTFLSCNKNVTSFH